MEEKASVWDDNFSVFSEETLVDNADSMIDSHARSSTEESQHLHSHTYLYVKKRVVKKMPEQKPPVDSTSHLGKLRTMLKSPAVKAAEKVHKVEGKSYHVDENGQIIETTVRRAFLSPGWNWVGGDIRQMGPKTREMGPMTW